jgi:hypothetical protein
MYWHDFLGTLPFLCHVGLGDAGLLFHLSVAPRLFSGYACFEVPGRALNSQGNRIVILETTDDFEDPGQSRCVLANIGMDIYMQFSDCGQWFLLQTAAIRQLELSHPLERNDVNLPSSVIIHLPTITMRLYPHSMDDCNSIISVVDDTETSVANDQSWPEGWSRQSQTICECFIERILTFLSHDHTKPPLTTSGGGETKIMEEGGTSLKRGGSNSLVTAEVSEKQWTCLSECMSKLNGDSPKATTATDQDQLSVKAQLRQILLPLHRPNNQETKHG